MWDCTDSQEVGLEAAILERVRNSSLVKRSCADNITGLKLSTSDGSCESMTEANAVIMRAPKSSTPAFGPWQPMHGELTTGHSAPQPARVAIPAHTRPCSRRQVSESGMICQVR